MAELINSDLFYAEGRGPELQRLCWSKRGGQLQAIEYFNPDDVFDEASLKHVRFERVQVVMITPEDVIGLDQLKSLADSGSASMLDLGKSPWLLSFSQQHLSSCHHFQLLFYDELIDIICERVTCHAGKFTSETEANERPT
ncbi:MAG TPA: hypothetical protein PL070_02890 [Flavobacteriales bacterium]|nr:hypothetical protein [Flavobacteriales bacterium]